MRNYQRWATILTLAVFVGLLLTQGLPAIAYRLSFAYQSGREDARAKTVQAGLNDLSEAFRQAAEKVGPSVVHISTARVFEEVAPGQTVPMGSVPRFMQVNQSSGVIISEDGLILTNHHVVRGVTALQVEVPGQKQTYPARLLGTDSETDLALLQIDADVPLPAATLGNSDELARGDWVIAIGTPYGLDQSVTAGIISAMGRSLGEGVQAQEFIQTDAAINPGNSGGPLVNLRGEVVGINTRTLGEGTKGIGFAIPSNLAARTAEQLKRHGRVVRGWLGVFVHEVRLPQPPASLPDSIHLHVDWVAADSPAARGGLNPGMTIVEFDGQPISSQHDFYRRISACQPRQHVAVGVVDAGAFKKLDVEIQPRPDLPVKKPGEEELRIWVEHLSPLVARSARMETEAGVFVVGVDPRGPGAELLGQVIVSLNGTPTLTLEAWCRAASETDFSAPVELLVNTNNGTQKIIVDTAK